MITRITTENMFSKGGKTKFIVPTKQIINRNSTFDEWEGFNKEVDIVRKVKDLFKNEINIHKFEHDPSKESTLEIQMKVEDKTYTYSMVFCDAKLVMESLLEGQTWIFSRLSDNPDFALDPSYFNEKGEKCYKYYKGVSPASLLFCFKPGEELLKEVRNIIVVDEWQELGHQEFIRRFESTFSDLSYNKLINEMIKEFGFSDSYDRLCEDNETLAFAGNPEISIELELSGSGFRRLSKLYPLMVASKKRGLMMISKEPLDYCLHPKLGKYLMLWFLKDNPNPPIGKLANIIL